ACSLLLLTVSPATPCLFTSPFSLSTPPATTEIYTLSLQTLFRSTSASRTCARTWSAASGTRPSAATSTSRWTSRPSWASRSIPRSEEHTSELQSRENLVCRLLLEKKNGYTVTYRSTHPMAQPETH